MVSARAILSVLLFAGFAGVASADGQHAEGDYGGVVPGQTQKTDTSNRPKKKLPKGYLSWVGYEQKDSASTIFFQSVGAFEVTQHVDNGALVVDISGLSALGANTWRPIDTHFFAGPIARIAVARVSASKGKFAHPAGLEAHITFEDPKTAAEGTVRTATEADGFFYAYLDFAGAPAAPTTQQPSLQIWEK